MKLNFPASKYVELGTFMESVSLEELVMVGLCKSNGLESRVQNAWFPRLETEI